MAKISSNYFESLMNAKKLTPATSPPSPGSAATSCSCKDVATRRKMYSYVSTGTRDLWNRVFDEGYGVDVCINTRNGDILYAHSNILVSSFINSIFILFSSILKCCFIRS